MENKKTIVINFFSGPGGGKSTMRAGLFYFLKCAGVKCEEAIEYAKGKVYEGSDPVLKNQVYVFGKQHHITNRSKKDVDVIISESPLLLSIVYDIRTNGKDTNETFRKLVLEEHNKFVNINYYLVRPQDREYQEFGRQQSKEEALVVDQEAKDVLESHNIEFTVVPSNHEGLMQIVEEVLAVINSNK